MVDMLASKPEEMNMAELLQKEKRVFESESESSSEEIDEDREFLYDCLAESIVLSPDAQSIPQISRRIQVFSSTVL